MSNGLQRHFDGMLPWDQLDLARGIWGSVPGFRTMWARPTHLTR